MAKVTIKGRKVKVDRSTQKGTAGLSPFELKDRLISLARDSTRQSDRTMLNAGRGNPNWIATTPREAFFTLGRFAIDESRRVMSGPDLGGMPQKEGIGRRFRAWAAQNGSKPGMALLTATVDYGVKELDFNEDEFVYELTDALIGDHYPEPDRMLRHAEVIARKYLEQEMCDRRPPKGKWDVFAVEGGTAAMCYIFQSLMFNGLLKKGDTIALGTPIFTPYLEITHFKGFKTVHIDSGKEMGKDGRHTWQYSEKEIAKLADKKVKAFFLVNPSNPPSYEIQPSTIRQIVKLVKTKRPDLMLLTDDVYGTFVPGFRSLMAELPYNTIGVYSYSKYFGCTGWRLGVVAIHENNLFDDLIAKMPKKAQAVPLSQYSTLTPKPEGMKFIDRMVADSRMVALNHTAGLSLPQQVQMTLFSSFALLDREDRYKQQTIEIVRRRMDKLFAGMNLELKPDPTRAAYYIELDLRAWAQATHGPEFVRFIERNFKPLDIVFALAQNHSTVLLNGDGFAGPPWSVRVSLANLDDDEYETIGQKLVKVTEGAVAAWKASQA